MACIGRMVVVVAWVAACGPNAGGDSGSVGHDGSGSEGGDCDAAPPVCDLQPDCSDEPPDAVCIDGEWSCPRAGLVAPAIACSEAEGEAEGEADGPMPSCGSGGDEVPPDCWDQGPGACSDAAQPASCDGSDWVCPPGWALGDFGPGCVWPSPEGTSSDSGSSDSGTDVTSSSTDGEDSGTSGPQ